MFRPGKQILPPLLAGLVAATAALAANAYFDSTGGPIQMVLMGYLSGGVVTPQTTAAGGGSSSSPVGAATFTPAQWSNATASATLIVAARTGVAGTGRVSVTLYNSGSTTFFYGPSGVTTANGTRLLAGGSRTIYTTAAIYGVPASGTSTCDYDETY